MPKITPEEIEAKIVNKKFLYEGVLTVCVIELDNGFFAVGDSAPVDPDEYDADVGEAWAYKKALDKCFVGEAYHRKELDFIAGEAEVEPIPGYEYYDENIEVDLTS